VNELDGSVRVKRAREDAVSSRRKPHQHQHFDGPDSRVPVPRTRRTGAVSSGASTFVRTLTSATVKVERVRDPANLATVLSEFADGISFFSGNGVLTITIATSDAAAVALLPASLCACPASPYDVCADSAVRAAYATPEAALVAQSFIGQPLVLTREWLVAASVGDVKASAANWLKSLQSSASEASAVLRLVRNEFEVDADDDRLPRQMTPLLADRPDVWSSCSGNACLPQPDEVMVAITPRAIRWFTTDPDVKYVVVRGDDPRSWMTYVHGKTTGDQLRAWWLSAKLHGTS